MTEIPDADTMKAFNKNIVDEFRANGGKVGGPFEGADLLLLTTIGAKSGEPRLAPLAYLSVDGKTIIIGSYAGADIHPAWVHNLRAKPWAPVQAGTTGYDVLFPNIVTAAPGVADYQAKTSRVIPLFELQRV